MCHGYVELEEVVHGHRASVMVKHSYGLLHMYIFNLEIATGHG